MQVWQVRARHESVHGSGRYAAAVRPLYMPQASSAHANAAHHAHTAHNGAMAQQALAMRTAPQPQGDVLSMYMEIKRKRRKEDHGEPLPDASAHGGSAHLHAVRCPTPQSTDHTGSSV